MGSIFILVIDYGWRPTGKFDLNPLNLVYLVLRTRLNTSSLNSAIEEVQRTIRELMRYKLKTEKNYVEVYQICLVYYNKTHIFKHCGCEFFNF